MRGGGAENLESKVAAYALTLPNTPKINSVYQQILGRQAQIGELLQWNGLLGADFEMNKLRDFLTGSEEFHQKIISQNRVLINLKKFKMYAIKNDIAVGTWIIRTNTYEPHVTQALINTLKIGDVFLDIGANIGYFTLLAASIVQTSGKVISFEPNVQNLQLIYASTLENNFENIRIYPFAVSDTNKISSLLSSGSNGTICVSSSSENYQMLQMVRVDEMLQNEEKINVIKMDIEGFEPFALRGMNCIIKKHRPIIFTEFHPWAISCQNNNPQEYLEQLISYNYKISIIETSGRITEATDSDFIMNFWRSLNNDTIHLDLIAKPV